MDEKLKFYEAEWKKERDARVALQKRIDHNDAQVRRLHQLDSDLRTQIDTLKQSKNGVEQANHALTAEVVKLAEQSSRIEAQLQRLSDKVTEPSFWEDMAALPLARALGGFDRLPEIASKSRSGDLTEIVFEIAELFVELERSYQIDKAGQLQELLLSQWVYARWLDVTAESKK